MNWSLVIPLLVILTIKLTGTSLFLVYFSQIFPAPAFQEPNSSTPDGRKECSRSWILFEGKCYFFSTFEKTWDASKKDCAQSNSRLAIVKSKAELMFLQTRTQHENYFIGLTQSGSVGGWKWIDNTELNPDIFNIPYKGFPCAVVGLSSTGTASCSVPHRWICEMNT
ncbi:C-type lectin domain family 5 member A-like [Hemicordylus capensis]|uniref:C-type lectin domain family 5 member A-like n=1 Tax=Hemicordylus capensis TaxID=884348 RepID=UPI0023032754|nr:C-type lectin domain family 5 member A-like [Hemicordylus capensis]XP_053150214.1 C-type lectin domain family 5 member A-like [Hemicordylus capensis]